MPNQEEIYSLVNYDDNKYPTSDFPNMTGNDYWSSTTNELMPDTVFTARCNYGYHAQAEKTKTTYVTALCVRNFP